MSKKKNFFQLQEKKIAAIQEKLELAEQKLAQYAKLPEMEEQLKQRMEALTQVRRPNQVRREFIYRHIDKKKKKERKLFIFIFHSFILSFFDFV